MTIDDITIQEYFTREDTTEYDMYIDILNPINKFAGRICNTNKLTFDEVQVMKTIFVNATLEDIKDIFVLCYGLRGSMKQSAEQIFMQTSIFDLFRAKNYLIEFIKTTVDKEIMWLSGKEDEKMQMINAKARLKHVSHLLTKMSLAEQFSITPDAVGLMRYSKVFAFLVANKVKADLHQEYNEIK